MKCPICDGELVVSKTNFGSFEGADYVEVDLMCTGEEHHRFFARLHEDDLIQEE